VLEPSAHRGSLEGEHDGPVPGPVEGREVRGHVSQAGEEAVAHHGEWRLGLAVAIS